MKRAFSFCLVLLVVLVPRGARADEVGDWTDTMLPAGLVAGTNPVIMTRVSAIVESAMFDAVNGIDRRYTHIRVPPNAAPGASRRAAVAQAAYVALKALFPAPATQAVLDARLKVAMTSIATHESSQSVMSGAAWGAQVANEILSWRSTDGFTNAPAFDGTPLAPGRWRPTPPANASGFGYLQFSAMTPWVMSTPFEFRSLIGGPPALASARYTRDFEEVKQMGSLTSMARTGDQTIYSLFWNSATVGYLWNRVALSLIDEQDNDDEHGKDNGHGKDNDHDDHRWNDRSGRSLVNNARLMARLNLAMADAAISCWDAKYHFVFWRPITAITLADTDGNPLTQPDAGWLPLFATPAHPDYTSGHSCTSGAAGAVLADHFGERTRFSVDSDLMLGVRRSFRSFSAALEEVKNARVFAGIHFRKACEDGQTLGAAVAQLVIDQAMRRVH